MHSGETGHKIGRATGTGLNVMLNSMLIERELGRLSMDPSPSSKHDDPPEFAADGALVEDTPPVASATTAADPAAKRREYLLELQRQVEAELQASAPPVVPPEVKPTNGRHAKAAG